MIVTGDPPGRPEPKNGTVFVHFPTREDLLWIGLVHHYLMNRDLFAPGESVIARRGRELLDHYMGLLAPVKGESL